MLYNSLNTEFLCEKRLTAEKVVRTLENLRRKGLQNLFVSSFGGESDVAELSLKYLLPRGVVTIGGEMVASAALSIFLCGSRRIAFPDSQFMFHETFMFYEDRIVYISEVEMLLEIALLTKQSQRAYFFARNLERGRRINYLTAALLRKKTALSFEKARELMRGDGTTLTAKEALLYGFVHEIIPRSLVEGFLL